MPDQAVANCCNARVSCAPDTIIHSICVISAQLVTYRATGWQRGKDNGNPDVVCKGITLAYITAENHVTLEIKNGGYLPKPLDSDTTFFNISINTDQIGMRFEVDTPEK